MMYDFFFLFQIAALIVCLSVYNKLGFPYKYFAPFLFVLTVYETAILMGWLRIPELDALSFNFYTSTEFTFYSLILFSLIRNKLHKKILFYVLVCTLSLTLINIIFLDRLNAFNTYTFTLQAFIIITACCIYYYNKVRDARNEILIIKEPTFWLYTGLLFYYLGCFLFFTSYSSMAYVKSPNYLILYRIVINVSNIILYSCLIKLFLCFRQPRI